MLTNAVRASSAIIIGRFQGPHLAHNKLIDDALEQAEKVIIVLGSSHKAPDHKNPWSMAERESMLRACYSPEDNDRLIFVGVRDNLYNDNLWTIDVQNAVSPHLEEGEGHWLQRVLLIGCFKDESSKYLRWFPQWELREHTPEKLLSATDVRHSMFEGTDDWRKMVDPEVEEMLAAFMKMERFEYLVEEYRFWKGYDGTKFPLNFMTTDAVVVKSGHILLVKRGRNPGKGLWALPGGFVNQDETVLQSCLRELKEETRIDVPSAAILKHLRGEKLCDAPDRSLRKRTISYAYFFDLGDGPLPKVKGDDDAAEARWVSFSDFWQLESQMFEDHPHIIRYFLMR